MPPPASADLAAWNAAQTGRDPADILAWAAQAFPGRVAFASSLGLEDQAITHLIATAKLPIPVFTLDTGRLFPETYDLIAATRERYGIDIRVLFPRTEAVEQYVAAHGIDGYRRSVELRKACCGIRKIEPLRRALSNLDAWVCGLRRDQSITRTAVAEVEWDAGNGLVKVNPLAAWSEGRLRAFIAAERIPVNVLHERGFPSIGCACCTRAIQPGEGIRAGRWWWEEPEHKECGLHNRPGKPAP